MAPRRGLLGRIVTATGWTAVTLPLLFVLSSLLLTPSSSLTLRIALLAFGLLAIVRPDGALLIPIAFANFGIILSLFAGMPGLRTTEVLVLASLAGYGIRALWSDGHLRRVFDSSVAAPAVLLALAAAVSTTVWQIVNHLEPGGTSTYLSTLWHFVSRAYFEQGDFIEVVSTVVVLEGLALCLVAAALARTNATFFERAMRMLALGGAGLGLLSIQRLAEIWIRNPAAIDALRSTSIGLRISPQIPDFIAAGSYFALCWLTLLGIALAASRRRLLWLVAGLPLIAAIYLTGSRSVIAASAVGLIVPLVIAARQKGASIRALAGFALLAIVVMAVSYSWMSGRDLAGQMARDSLAVRGELIKTGGRVLATRPLFGIGIDRFYRLAQVYASPELRAMWPARMNPHNDFLRFAVELGLVGVAAFVWIVLAAGMRIGRALSRTRDAGLAGLAGGLVAFLVTSLFSNPLMVRDVSYVFWIALGLAVGYSERLLSVGGAEAGVPNAAPQGLQRRLPWRWAPVAVVGVVLLISIPSRTAEELALVNPTRVSYGLYEWQTDHDGTRWRWSGATATFYVDARTRVLEIPLSGRAADVRQDVQIRINGRPANQISVGPEWLRLRTLLPPNASIEPYRIDIAVSPTWESEESTPGGRERRTYGVRVGEVGVTKAP